MLTPAQVEQYRELGYLVVPDVLGRELLAEVRRRVDAIVADAAKVTAHTDVYDLEDTHSRGAPRVRRIKTPHKHFPFFNELTRSTRITSILAQLIGPDIRLHGSKLNMKSAGYGAPVEWHQDWAFYIHHARLVHGSALNTSGKPRRLLLHEYTAADAWPLMGVANFDDFNDRMVLGEPSVEPRIVPAPVRMPLPAAEHQGSIYENQRAAGRRFFETAAGRERLIPAE